MAIIQIVVEEQQIKVVEIYKGTPGAKGDPGDLGDIGTQGLPGEGINCDGGVADSVYGGIDPIDGGTATSF